MARGFGGIPGMSGNIQSLMKQAKQLQDQMQQAQGEVETYEAEGSAGGGMVKIVANGKNQIVSVKIDPQVVSSGDIEMLQDLVLAAANDGLTKVQEKARTKLSSLTGGVNIPGMF